MLLNNNNEWKSVVVPEWATINCDKTRYLKDSEYKIRYDLFIKKVDEENESKRKAKAVIYAEKRSKELKIEEATKRINKMYHRTSSRSLRDTLDSYCPKWKNHALLMAWLIRGTMSSETTKQLLLPQEYLAVMEGKSKDYLDSNYSAKKYIDRFSLEVAKIVLTNNGKWNKQNCIARTVEFVEWPEEIQQEISKFNNRVSDKDSVYLISGQKVSRRKKIKMMKEFKKENISTDENISLLNSANPSFFQTIIEDKNKIKKAISIADTLDHPEIEKRKIQAIIDFPKPFYEEKENTDRYYTDGDSLQFINSDIRNAILGDGLIEVDLAHVQLSVCANRWNAITTGEALKKDVSIWNSFYRQFPEYDPQLVKKWCKKAIYSLCFGSARETRRKYLNQISPNAFNIFHNNIYIKDMTKARNEFIKLVRLNKRVKLPKNKWLSINEYSVPQILAIFAQSYEQALIQPIFDLSKKYKDDDHGFMIVCYEFDGFHLKVKKSQDIEDWKKRLADAVDQTAKKLGISTKLEFKN